MKEFKVGDLVYCPSISPEILTIKTLPKDVMVFDITQTISESDCGFVTYLNSGNIIRLKDGKCMKTFCPKVVHATPENHELLERLYGVEFEKPLTTPTSHEIIKALLGKGYDNIPCWVSDDCEQPTHKDKWVFISYCGDTPYSKGVPYTDSVGYDWVYATPFNPTTFKAITELPND